MTEAMRSGVFKEDRERLSMKDFKVAGFPLPLYVLILALTAACMFTGCVPKSLVPAFLVLMVFGEGLNAIGNNVPVVKTYLGGSVICILGSAILTAGGLIPEQTLETLDYFVNDSGFLIRRIHTHQAGIVHQYIHSNRFPNLQNNDNGNPCFGGIVPVQSLPSVAGCDCIQIAQTRVQECIDNVGDNHPR